MARPLPARALACVGLLLLTGCHARRGLPPDMSAYHGVVSGALFAFGWGGAAGYQDEDEIDTRVVFRPDEDAGDYRLVMCDPSQSPCDSVPLFRDMDLKARPIAGGLLWEFRTKMEKADRLLMVVATRGGQMLTSDAIAATAASRPTGYAKDGLTFDRVAQKLSWPRVPDAASYILTLVDERDEDGAATGVVTRRKSWTYPELQGIVQYFHDPASVHDLDARHRYVALLFAVNERRWATLLTDLAVVP